MLFREAYCNWTFLALVLSLHGRSPSERIQRFVLIQLNPTTRRRNVLRRRSETSINRLRLF